HRAPAPQDRRRPGDGPLHHHRAGCRLPHGSGMSGPRRPALHQGLATRLLIGQTLVLLAGALTVGLVAAVVGPPIFHDHLLQTGHPADSPELVHIELAYRNASLTSLGWGLLISVMAAGAVTWVLARLLRRPL